MPAPTYPAAANLTEGTGTRSFTALSTNAGDWIVVATNVESDGNDTTHSVPTATGLTFTNQVDTGQVDDTHQRLYFWIAQDTTGGSRTIQCNPPNSLRRYYARATVVRGSTGVGNVGSNRTAQTFSFTRNGANSGIFMQVGDWSAGAVGSPSWSPSGSTTASQQGTFGTYIFGRIDDSGAAGSSSTGISSPSYTTPGVAALEMLGTADVGGGLGPARPGQTWKRVYKHRQRLAFPPSVVADVRNDTAESQIGLSADATVKKVAVVTAVSSLGLAGTSTAAKVAKSTGPATLGLASISTAKKVSTPTASGTIGLAANFVHVDIRPITALATVGFTGTSTAKKVTPTTSVGTVGLAGTATTKKVSKNTGLGTIGLTSLVTARKVAPATGRGTIGLQASFAHVEIHPITALATLGATAYLTGKKRSTPLAAGTIGLTGNALPKKISKSTGVGILPLTGQAVAFKQQAITGRSPLGLAAWWDKNVTGLVAYVEVVGGSTSGTVGARSNSGVVEAGSTAGTVGAESVSGAVEGGTVAGGLPA